MRRPEEEHKAFKNPSGVTGRKHWESFWQVFLSEVLEKKKLPKTAAASELKLTLRSWQSDRFRQATVRAPAMHGLVKFWKSALEF